MKLNPCIPPGRSNRKARAFSAEIAQLCLQGYGCKAIHQALINAGLEISKSTVQREVARISNPASHKVQRVVKRPIEPHPAPAVPLRAAPGASVRKSTGEARSSMEVAEAFFEGRITNPLLRKRT